MRKYDSYKDSGVEWIGEIPSHWGVTKHKFNLSILSGFPFKSELFDHYEGFPLIRIRDITTGKLETFYKGEVLPDYVVHKGDLLVGMDGDYNIRWWESEEGLLNQRCCSIIESDKIFRRFLFYILPMELKILNDLTYYTTVKHLSVSDIYNTITILPPLSEQQQIVTFLDIKTLFIDSLIKKTQQKIELLKEKRTSLINELVTKGLNPNVEMKDSGVEWIGEIPSHWRILKNKYFLTQEIEKSESGDEELLSVSEYNGIIPRKSIRTEGELSRSESLVGYLKVQKGQLVSNIMLTWKRGLGVSDISGIVSPAYSVFSFSNSYPKYYHYLFRTDLYTTEFKKYSKGVIESRLRLYDDSFFRLFSHFPPLSEQQQIVEYLDEHTQLIDKTISVEQRRIDTLKEYRQSLISEVVTGKIDVCQDNGIPWFQKPVPKVTIHKFETRINRGREAIISTVQPIWGKDVYDIVLDNLEIVNSLFTSDLQFELISKYLIPVGKDPDDCYFLLKDNSICGIFYFKNYYESHNEDYSFRPEGTLFEIVGTEIEISTTERMTHWVFNDLMKKGFSSFLLYYKKSYGRTSSDDVLTFKKIKEKLSNG